jgi:hypothetical protein
LHKNTERIPAKLIIPDIHTYSVKKELKLQALYYLFTEDVFFQLRQ